jgi:hypothetical protein
MHTPTPVPASPPRVVQPAVPASRWDRRRPVLRRGPAGPGASWMRVHRRTPTAGLSRPERRILPGRLWWSEGRIPSARPVLRQRQPRVRRPPPPLPPADPRAGPPAPAGRTPEGQPRRSHRSSSGPLTLRSRAAPARAAPAPCPRVPARRSSRPARQRRRSTPRPSRPSPASRQISVSARQPRPSARASRRAAPTRPRAAASTHSSCDEPARPRPGPGLRSPVCGWPVRVGDNPGRARSSPPPTAYTCLAPRLHPG